MRMRIISAAVVLALGIVGITLAQQTGVPPKDRASERAKLRTQAIKLRVEIELLELEHDAARGELLDIIKETRKSESRSPEELQELALEGMMLLAHDREAIGKFVEKEGEKAVSNILSEALKKTIDDFKASRDRKKKDYAKQAEELAGRRLELADVEKRYNEAK